MRLALIRQRYTPFGGAERFIERAVQALERNGASVTLVTRSWGAPSQRRLLIVNPPFAGRLWRDRSFSRGVQTLLQHEKFDLVQSHERIPGCDLYRAGDGVHAQWLDHRLKHAGWGARLATRMNPYHWYVCAAERAMFEHPRLRAVICNSKMVAREIGARFAISADKLHVIYNGVDLEHFHPDRRSELRRNSRLGLGWGEHDIGFCFVGSGFARKGLATAIRALAASGRHDLRLVVAGHDRNSASYEEMATKSGVGKLVTFVGAQRDVRFVYAAADCLVLPTQYDPFPNAALEALAMGLPAIVSDQCGAAEVIDHGANGWICKPEAIQPLGRLMCDAADAIHADGNGLNAAARRTAEGFGIDRMADQMIRLYEAQLVHNEIDHG